MQLGFIIDQSRCIGCHACTVACKSENDVPVGSFRTWVKYTESGEFPTVDRSFSVLRCNQCTDAPCIEICPVTALEKRADGIVDVDPQICIGCKSCMHGCPYDALYINPDNGTAEKCHFCVHRTERGLAPACAVVCPTEAIIPGDFDDPESRVSRMREEFSLSARKVEARTGPNVFYKDASVDGLDPLRTSSAGGYIWANLPEGPHLDAQRFAASLDEVQARTVYDVPRAPLWGGKITTYLFAKSLAAGIFPVAVFHMAPFRGDPGGLDVLSGVRFAPLLSLVALTVTSLVLVFDLKRPERFYLLLIRPNFDSWLARGTFILMAYGALVLPWFFASSLPAALAWPLAILGVVAGAGSAGYTGLLFGQAKGRVLWMRRGLAFHLVVQAALAGSAALLLVSTATGELAQAGALRWTLVGSLALHVLCVLSEGAAAPRGREREYHRAMGLVHRGPFARRHWTLGIAAGIVLPAVLLAFVTAPWATPAAGALVLLGLFIEEDVLVRAGQSLPIS